MKRMFAIVLSLMMALGMMTTAFAYDITIAADANSGLTDNHVYTVYQLFTGDLATVDGKPVLSNIKYGSAGLGTEGTVVPDTVLGAIEDADAYADQILNDETLTLADCGTLEAPDFTLSGVDAGYYLIVDETGKTLEEGDTYSRYIVKVVEDVTMAPKSEKVTSDKKEYNDDVELTDKNDAGVGTVVSYELKATVDPKAGSYKTYYFIMNDTLSTGLTFNDDIVVTIDGTVATEGVDYAVYKAPNTENGHTFEIALLNAKAKAGKEVVVNYSATLNENAVITDKETNTFNVIYTRDPHCKDEPDESKPGKPVVTDTDAYGKTPDSITETYDCEIDLTKYADTVGGALLEGAVFQLKSDDANQTVVKTHSYYQLDNENGTYYKLNDGTYTEEAPVADHFVAFGTGDANTEAGYILVDGKYVVPTDVEDYDGETLYQFVKGNGDKYIDGNKYTLVEDAEETSSVSAPVNEIATTGADGKIKFTGLGTGTYTLTELVAPEGYNLAAPKTIKITFENGKFTATVDGNATDMTNYTYATDVVDKKGSTLPETGGIGTTLFYTVGGMMVVAAGVLLITKKRMNA